MSPNNEFQARVTDRLATYKPRLVTQQQWEDIRGDVERLVIAAEPPYEADVSSLVATLLLFLQHTCRDGQFTLDVLTPDKIEDFIRIKKAAGTPKATLHQMRPRLRRLARAYAEEEIWRCRPAARHRVSPFHPYSDDEVRAMRSVPLTSAQQHAVDVAFVLCERMGLSRLDAGAARVVDGQIMVGDQVVATLEPDDLILEIAADAGPVLDREALASARDAIESATGLSLRLTNIRHRFLERTAAQHDVSVAELMLQFGVGRDDIEILIPFSATRSSAISYTDLVKYLTGDVSE